MSPFIPFCPLLISSIKYCLVPTVSVNRKSSIITNSGKGNISNYIFFHKRKHQTFFFKENCTKLCTSFVAETRHVIQSLKHFFERKINSMKQTMVITLSQLDGKITTMANLFIILTAQSHQLREMSKFCRSQAKRMTLSVLKCWFSPKAFFVLKLIIHVI